MQRGAHTPNDGPPLRLGQAFLVIDPAAFAGNDAYFERIETLAAAMLEDDGVRLPGDRRHALVARAAKEGIEVNADLEQQLREYARENRVTVDGLVIST
jgi:(2R)-3-sulfolactate dehydrogenase (NADP+)